MLAFEMINELCTLPFTLFVVLLSFSTDNTFACCSFACCLNPAFRRASATAFFIAFDVIVAPETASTLTLPLFRISFITAFALSKYSGVSECETITISVNFPSLMVMRTVIGPP